MWHNTESSQFYVAERELVSVFLKLYYNVITSSLSRNLVYMFPLTTRILFFFGCVIHHCLFATSLHRSLVCLQNISYVVPTYRLVPGSKRLRRQVLLWSGTISWFVIALLGEIRRIKTRAWIETNPRGCKATIATDYATAIPEMFYIYLFSWHFTEFQTTFY